MKKLIIAFTTLFLAAEIAAQPGKALDQSLTKKRVRLPNGWHLSPAGKSLPLGDLPLNLALSASKKYMAVTNNGQSVQSLQLIDTRTEKILDNEIIPVSWYGLKFSSDEKFLYASGGNDNIILKYAIINNKFQLNDTIRLGKKWPVKISPTYPARTRMTSSTNTATLMPINQLVIDHMRSRSNAAGSRARR